MSAKRSTERDEERKLAEDTRLLRDRLAGRGEERHTALAGPHGALFEHLLFILKNLEVTSADTLLGYVRAIDRVSSGSDMRLIVLHEINATIVALRELSFVTSRRSTTALTPTSPSSKGFGYSRGMRRPPMRRSA